MLDSNVNTWWMLDSHFWLQGRQWLVSVPRPLMVRKSQWHRVVLAIVLCWRLYFTAQPLGETCWRTFAQVAGLSLKHWKVPKVPKMIRWAKSAKNDHNRANQLNPTHPEYSKSRRQPPPPKNDRQAFAARKASAKKQAGRFEHEANSLAPKDKVDHTALEQFRQCLPRDAQLRKTGSRAKGSAIRGSDWDYHIATQQPMTREQRDEVLSCCRQKPAIKKVRCNKAFTVIPRDGAPIDFFPPNAEWNSGVPVQMPGSVQLNNGHKRAVKMLKNSLKSQFSGHELESCIFKIQREKGWSDKNDLSGEKRFQEAQRRLRVDGLCWWYELLGTAAASSRQTRNIQAYRCT